MHTRHRPKTWDEVLGNSVVIRSLRNSKPEKPIMLLGDPGLGKTTIAYILAREFGAPEQNIYHYNGINLLIENTRELMSQINLPTIFGHKKAIIIDEIHGVPDRAQQEMLIPLENIKGNTLVVACTTSVEKVNTALLERFKQFTLKPLSDQEALSLINRVCERESLNVPKPIKILVIEKCRGVPRRILIGLDKIKNITDEEEAGYLLELASLESEGSDILTLLKVILNKPVPTWGMVKPVLTEVLKKKDPRVIRTGLMNLLKARVLSNYFKENESTFILNMYSIISSPLSPEAAEADLVMNVMRAIK